MGYFDVLPLYDEREAAKKNQGHSFSLSGRDQEIFSDSAHNSVVSWLPEMIWADAPVIFSFSPLKRATHALFRHLYI